MRQLLGLECEGFMLRIPDWLGPRKIKENDCSLLAEFAGQFGITTFLQITDDQVRASGSRGNLADFYKLVRLLGLYGVVFEGDMARYSRKTDSQMVLIQVAEGDDRSVRDVIADRSLVLFLNGLTVVKMTHLNGIGADLLTVQVRGDIIETLEQVEGLSLVSQPQRLLEFYASEINENKVSGEDISTPAAETDLTEDLDRETGPETTEIETERETETLSGPLVRNIDLSLRARNMLLKNRITTVGQLLDLKESDLSKLKGGIESKEQIRIWIKKNGGAQPASATGMERELGSVAEAPKTEEQEPRDLLDTSIWFINLNARAKNVLAKNKIRTVGELMRLTEQELAQLGSCGTDTVKHIQSRLKQFIEDYQLQKKLSPEVIKQEIKKEFLELGLPEEVSELLVGMGIASIEQLKLLSETAACYKGLLSDETAAMVLKALQKVDSEFSVANKNVSDQVRSMIELKVPIAENLLFKRISGQEFPKPTIDCFDRSDYHYGWQILLQTPRVVVKEVGVSAFSDFVRWLSETGSIEWPVELLENEFLIGQLVYSCNHFEEEIGSILNLKEMEVYKERKLRTPPATLDEIGKRQQVTRERIRQICVKAEKKIANAFSNRLVPLKRSCNRCLKAEGDLISFSHVSVPIDYRSHLNWFVQEILELRIVFDRTLSVAWNVDMELINDSGSEEVFHNLFEISNDALRSVGRDEIKHEASEFLRARTGVMENTPGKLFESLCEEIVEDVVTEFLVADGVGVYRRKDLSLSEQIGHEFAKHYPKGELVYRHGEQLWEKLCEHIPNLANRGGVRYLARIFAEHPDIYMWDTGHYIHHKNVKVDMSVVDEMVNECVDELDKGATNLKVHLLFERHHDRVTKAGMPTSYALYSLLRKKNHKRLNLADYPMIRDANNEEDSLSQDQMIEEFVLNKGSRVTIDEIMDHFKSRGWRPIEVENHLKRCMNILSPERGVWVYRDSLEIDEGALAKLVEKIQEELLKLPHFNLRHIRSKFPVVWNSVCKCKLDFGSMEKLLLDVEELPFKISRAYVTELGSEDRLLSDEITEWVRSYGNFVFMDQIEKEFCQNRGYSGHSLGRCMYNTDLLTCYANCVVHPEVIGLDSRSIDKAERVLIAAAHIQGERGFAHVPFRLITKEFGAELPGLRGDFEWNEELLVSIAEKLDSVIIFNQAFVLKDNNFNVLDLDDLIGYIIGTHFRTNRVTVKELEKYLRSQDIIELTATARKNELFMEGSSIELVDLDTVVILSAIGRERYLKDQ